MLEFETIEDTDLQAVSGGDWQDTAGAVASRVGRTAYNALDKAAFPFSYAVGAGRNLAGTPGAIAGGLIGAPLSVALSPATLPVGALHDVASQIAGQPTHQVEHRKLIFGQ